MGRPVGKPGKSAGRQPSTANQSQALSFHGAVKRKRVGELITFATELQRSLPALSKKPDQGNTLEETERYINILDTLNTTGHQDEEVVDLERAAVDLSNLAHRLRREAHPGSKKLLLSARVLGFLMLDRAQFHETNSLRRDIAHLMKLALKIARTCLDEDEAGVSVPALSRAKVYDERLMETHDTDTEDDITAARRLRSEFFVLRTALSWKQGNLDVAEHLYRKVEGEMESFDVHTAEQIAEVVYTIGKDLLAKKDFVTATKWLDRSCNTLGSREVQMLSAEGAELRLAAMKSLVKASLELGTKDGNQEARNIVSYLEGELGQSAVVLLLQLDLINKLPAEEFDGDAYAKVLSCMIRTLSTTESRFTFIVHHILMLGGKDAAAGNKVCDEYLASLSEAGDMEMVDRLACVRVRMITSQRVTMGSFEQINKALATLKAPLGPATAAACQMLLGKLMDAEREQKHFDISALWCRLGLATAFQQVGYMNLGKVGRKLLLCLVELNDFDGARSAYYEMSEEAQQHPLTACIMYKVAIRSQDHSLATECLNKIKDRSDGHELIHACALEANRSCDRHFMLEAMQALASTYGQSTATSKIHLPALFRCIIRLAMQSLEEQVEKGGDEDALTRCVEVVCAPFEHVVRVLESMPKHPGEPVVFDVKELQWFGKNAFNLGIQHCGSWKQDQVVRILSACSAIIAQYPSDMASSMGDELALRQCFCSFVVSAAMIADARAHDNIDRQAGLYGAARDHISAFDTSMQSILHTVGETCGEDLVKKWAILSVFDFEAAANLGQWDDLREIARKSEQCKSGDGYRRMLDILLQAGAPAHEVCATMQLLVDSLWEIEKFGSEAAVKYYRVLFQVTLARDTDAAFKLLDDFCSLVEEASKTDRPFSADELEWITATCFNEAVNFRDQNQIEQMESWADRAIKLAAYFDFDGALTRNMKENLQKMRHEELDGPNGLT